jgi:hypothetical protein
VSIAITRFSAEQEGAADGKLSDRATSPYRDGVAGLDVAKHRRHVAGRKDIGQKQYLFVSQAVRNFERAEVGEGHPQIFGLTAGIAAEKMRVSE